MVLILFLAPVPYYDAPNYKVLSFAVYTFARHYITFYDIYVLFLTLVIIFWLISSGRLAQTSSIINLLKIYQ